MVLEKLVSFPSKTYDLMLLVFRLNVSLERGFFVLQKVDEEGHRCSCICKLWDR